MAQITVRKIDSDTRDVLYGNGQANFLFDIEAVAQIIKTWLSLFEGE